MLSTTPLVRPHAAITRFNPTAKIIALTVFALTTLIATDIITPLLVLSIMATVIPFSGIRITQFLYRLRYLTTAALSVAIVSALFAAEKTGTIYIDYGPVLLTESSVQSGIALGLRVSALAVPGVLVLATLDPTDLADSLIQQCRVSPRFAIGSLAAFRMLPLLANEWQLISMARRARGIDAGWNPLTRARLFTTTMFTLLVGAIRRGTRLATAMDARGFDSDEPRSIARPQRIGFRDWVLIAAAIAASVLIVVIVAAPERFNPFG